MRPSDEALAWQHRADAWAQEAEQGTVEPASRWSDVAPTGRSAQPPDGVGWRTETAEWRATGARWRQTTEWRSTTGSHGWRSTTEAWEADGANGNPPRSETRHSQPAISGTAWQTPEPAPAEPEPDRPVWQQFTGPGPEPWRQQASQPEETWQQPAPRRPAESSPSWQQLVEPTGPRNDPVDASTWGEPRTGGWSRDDGRHLVREDDRAAWRRGAAEVSETSRVGRRRAPETPAGGTGWATSSESDNWAGHADTGNIQLYPQEPSWSASGRYSSPVPAPRAEEPDENRRGDNPEEAAGRRGRYGEPAPEPETRLARRRREAAEAAYRSASARSESAYPAPNFSEPTYPESGYLHQANPELSPQDPGYQQDSRQEDPYREETAPRSGPPKGRARYNQVNDDWREHTGSWAAEPDTSNWTRDPDTGQWSRADNDPRVLAWREEAARREADETPATPQQRALPAAPRRDQDPSTGTAAAGAPPTGAVPGNAPRSGTGFDGTRGDSAVGGATFNGSTPGGGTRGGSAPGGSAFGGSARSGSAFDGGARSGSAFGGSEPAPRGPFPPRESGGGSAASAYSGEPGSAPRSGMPDRGSGGPGSGRYPSDEVGRSASDRQLGRAEDRFGGPDAYGDRAAGYDDRSGGFGGSGFGGNETGENGFGGRAGDRVGRTNGYGERADSYGGRAADQVGRDGGRAADQVGRDDSYGRRAGNTDGRTNGYGGRAEGLGGTTGGYGRDAAIRGERTNGYGGRADGMGGPAGGFGMGADGQGGRTNGYGGRSGGSGGYGMRALPSGPSAPTASGAEASGYTERDSTGFSGTSAAGGLPGNAPRSGAAYRAEPDDPYRTGNRQRPGDADQRSWTQGDRSRDPDGRREPGNRPGEDSRSWPRDAAGRARPALGSARPVPGSASAPPSDWRTSTYGGRNPSRGGDRPETSDRPALSDRPAISDRPALNGRTDLNGSSGSAQPGRSADRGRAPDQRRGGSGDRRSDTGGGASAPANWRTETRGGQASAPGDWRTETRSGQADWRAELSGGSAAPASADRRTELGGAAAPADWRAELNGGAAPAADWRAELNGGAAPAADWRAELNGGAAAATDWRGDVGGGSPALGQTDWRAELGGGSEAPADWRTDVGGAAAPQADWRADLTDQPWRRDAGTGAGTYREGAGADWRRELAESSELADGESRRFGTSDYVPFRSSGSAAVPRSSNLSMTSTSLISPMPREQREATARGGALRGPTGSYERRAVTGGFSAGRRSSGVLDADDEEDDQEAGGPLVAVGYTVIWYGVPVVLFLAYMLISNNGTAQALNTLSSAAPQFGLSLVLSLGVAVGIRYVSQTWKAISVGLAAAVVGGGLATVLTSAITGNSLS